MSFAVATQGLSKNFGKFCALDDVSMNVPSGSLFGLLGPNGAGKTTLMSVAAGFISATRGSVQILGTDTRRISELKGRFAMLPQDASLQADIPILEQLILFGRLSGLTREEARRQSLQSLKFVGLERISEQSINTLSHGMAKRVSVAQTFIGSPEVIFLDEPTAGLDPDSARSMRMLVKELQGRGRTVVFSSHNLQEVQDLCDGVGVLFKGKLLEVATMADFVSAGRLIRIEVGPPLPPAAESALAALACVERVEKTSAQAFNLHLSESQGGVLEDDLKPIYGALAAHDVWPRSIFEGASLETRFLELTGGVYDGASSS